MSGTREGTVIAFIKESVGSIRGDHDSISLYYNPQQVNIQFYIA